MTLGDWNLANKVWLNSIEGDNCVVGAADKAGSFNAPPIVSVDPAMSMLLDPHVSVLRDPSMSESMDPTMSKSVDPFSCVLGQSNLWYK